LIVTPFLHLLHQTFARISCFPWSGTLAQSRTAGSSARFGIESVVMKDYAFAVCTQSSQGSTSQPQSDASPPDLDSVVWQGRS